MPPQIATLIFIVGIGGLFWLDRDRSVLTSKALWLPILWLATAGSRSISAWLGMGAPPEIPGQLPEASPLDQLFAGALILSGVVVLIQRRYLVKHLLKASWPTMLYFSFCLVSLTWSDFPMWGFKRWIRGLGDLIMVLIVVTDAQPNAALRLVFSRIGFVLLPASVLLIKYYPALGRSFGEFGDANLNVGVTTNKNALGGLAFVIGLGALWQVIELLLDKTQPNRTRRFLAHGTLLAFGIDLLFTANSATAGASFVLGAGLMIIATCLPLIRSHPASVHALVLLILLGGSLFWLLGGKVAMVEAVGRNPDLTGRTVIWEILIPLAPNPIGGAGFETFWAGPRVAKVFSLVGGMGMTNEAHNGYLEVYLNLGWLGLAAIALVLGHGYRRSVDAFRRNAPLGALLMVYVVTVLVYAVTEAVFRMLALQWFFLLLAIITAANVTADLGGIYRFASGRSLPNAALYRCEAAATSQLSRYISSARRVRER